MRFYEVHAKSALNRVPEASRMPFRWTINPYRGCTPCVRLLPGGRHADPHGRRLAQAARGAARRRRDLRHRAAGQVPALRAHAGARALGDREAGASRRCSRTAPSSSPAATTGSSPSAAGSTSPVPSAGRPARPHLTTGRTRCSGPGRFAAGPEHSDDYERGYLCGMVRGDGNLASYAYDRPARRHRRAHRFRLALADGEALERAERYLLAHGVHTTRLAVRRGARGTTRRSM